MNEELFKKTYPYICGKCRQFAHSYYEYCEKCGRRNSLKKARRRDYGLDSAGKTTVYKYRG